MKFSITVYLHILLEMILLILIRRVFPSSWCSILCFLCWVSSCEIFPVHDWRWSDALLHQGIFLISRYFGLILFLIFVVVIVRILVERFFLFGVQFIDQVTFQLLFLRECINLVLGIIHGVHGFFLFPIGFGFEVRVLCVKFVYLFVVNSLGFQIGRNVRHLLFLDHWFPSSSHFLCELFVGQPWKKVSRRSFAHRLQEEEVRRHGKFWFQSISTVPFYLVL